jgi:hypothetical protein
MTAILSSAPGTEPSGDYMGSYFLPDGMLGVIWTRRELPVPGASIERSISASPGLPYFKPIAFFAGGYGRMQNAFSSQCA